MENTIERTDTAELLARIEARDRLTFEEWKAVEDTASTEELGRLADKMRRDLHPDDVVTTGGGMRVYQRPPLQSVLTQDVSLYADTAPPQPQGIKAGRFLFRTTHQGVKQ